MPLAFYMDVHVKQAITDGLRRRGVEVLTAAEDGNRRLLDDELLDRALELGRVLVTYDIGFRVMAEQWQREARPFAGLVFTDQDARIGWFVDDFQLNAFATEREEWVSCILWLPYPR